MQQPLFSIITVTFNAEATLPSTLQSVAEQTFADYEYIIQDGGSKDATVGLARGAGNPRCRIESEPDKGIYDAMNKAMDHATGEYLIFLNAGDAFHSPTTLAEIAEAIRNNGHPGIVYGQTDIVDSRRRRLGPRHLEAPATLTLDSFRNGMLVCHQAFVVLRRIAGPYDLRFRFSADYEWCIRCLQHSRNNVNTGLVLIDYLNEGATTANRFASLRERFAIMSRYYGFWSTAARHLGFALRFMRRRRQEKKMAEEATGNN